MKNKLIFFLTLIFLSVGVFSQEINIGNATNCNTENILTNNNNSTNNSNVDYNALEKQINKFLNESNKECLNLLNLSKNQKEKINKLQNSYLSTAKVHGALLKQAYIEYNNEYYKNPNSVNTKHKLENLKKLAECTKQDYNKYQEQLFKILDSKQIKAYNQYLDKKLKEARQKWKNNYKK